MKIEFKWFHYIVILVLFVLICYHFKWNFIYFYLIVSILTVNYLWKFFFCRGIKNSDESTTFNLSKFAESLYIISFILLATTTFYLLFINRPIWYEWILPIVFIFAYLAKVFNIKQNINDSIKINSNLITWKDEEIEKSCKIIKCYFSYQKSESFSVSISTENEGWHLNFYDELDNFYKLDLKNMNLNGHKKSIEKLLIKNGLFKDEK